MPVTRPSTYPDWCLTGTRTNPGSPLINTGYQPNFRPPAEYHNWQFGYIGDWIRWLDQQEQIDAAQFEFDAIVGTNGTYADINALIAAIVGGATGLNKILVTTPQTLTTTQVITAAMTDMEFVFKPQALYVQGASLAIGIRVHGQRITIRNGRFGLFNNVGNVAIQLESDSKNCRITDCNFFTNATSINDLGTNNNLSNNIEEV